MNETTQTGIAMAVIGLLGVVTGKLFDLLNTRDKLRYDSQLSALEAQNATQAGQIANLTTTQKACEEKHQACEEQQQTHGSRIADLERALGNKVEASVLYSGFGDTTEKPRRPPPNSPQPPK